MKEMRQVCGVSPCINTGLTMVEMSEVMQEGDWRTEIHNTVQVQFGFWTGQKHR